MQGIVLYRSIQASNGSPSQSVWLVNAADFSFLCVFLDQGHLHLKHLFRYICLFQAFLQLKSHFPVDEYDILNQNSCMPSCSGFFHFNTFLSVSQCDSMWKFDSGPFFNSCNSFSSNLSIRPFRYAQSFPLFYFKKYFLLLHFPHW